METLVSRPLEGSLSGLKNMRRISSISAQGFSKITIEFAWGTKVPNAEQQIISTLAKVKNILPQGAAPVVENIGSTLQEIAGYAVKSKDGKIGQSALRNLVEYRIVPLLRSVGGISKIDVCGGEKEAYIVDASPYALGDYNVSLCEIANKISRANLNVHGGELNRYYSDFPISGICRIKGINDIKNVLIRYSPPHPPLVLGKLSKIFKGSLPKRYLVHTDRVQGVVFSVYKQPNTNTLKAAEGIRKKLKEIKDTLPNSIKISPYYSQAELIKDESHNLAKSIILGAFLVTFVLMFLLDDIWGGIIIALTLPQIIFVSFIFFYLFGFSLNIMTLGGFAVAVGMLVDGSIIVLENIYRHRQMGKNRIAGAIAGTGEIMGADISGVLTTVAVFLPFLFLGGLPGRLFIPFGFAVSIVLILSLAFSLTFIPVVMGQRKAIKAIDKGGKSPGTILFAFLKNINKKMLTQALKHRKTAVVLSILALVITAFLMFLSPVSFLPEIDEGSILCEYILPPGTSFEESKRIAGKLENIISKNPEVISTYLRVGSAEKTYQVERVNRGEIIAKLTKKNKRKKGIKEIIQQMKKNVSKIKGVMEFFHQPTMEKIDESFSGLPVVFGITIYGDNYNELAKYAKKIEKLAKKCPMTGNVVNNAVLKIPEIDVKLERKKMNSFGLNPEDVLREISLAMKGEIVTETIKEEKTIPVFLISGKFPPSKKTIADLRNLPIRIPDGGFISLSDIAKIENSYNINQLNHTNLHREITLSLEADGGIGKIVKWFKRRLPSLHIPAGYFVEFTGQYKSLIKSLKGLLLSAGLAIILIYLIMLIQFNSAFQPLVILSELPLSFIGGGLALAITRQPINISSLIGFLALIGIAVNNGIILIDYTNRMRKEGMKREEALEKSANVRVRPIFLTTITTVFGLIPIALGSGIHKPLAVVIIGGLLLSSFLTLNVLPVVYCLLEDFTKKMRLKSFS